MPCKYFTRGLAALVLILLSNTSFAKECVEYKLEQSKTQIWAKNQCNACHHLFLKINDEVTSIFMVPPNQRFILIRSGPYIESIHKYGESRCHNALLEKSS